MSANAVILGMCTSIPQPSLELSLAEPAIPPKIGYYRTPAGMVMRENAVQQE